LALLVGFRFPAGLFFSHAVDFMRRQNFKELGVPQGL
jgi:hypothetical protein